MDNLERLRVEIIFYKQLLETEMSSRGPKSRKHYRYRYMIEMLDTVLKRMKYLEQEKDS